MINMHTRKTALKLANVLVVILVASMGSVAAAHAAGCPGAGSRAPPGLLAVDAPPPGRVGLKIFPQPLPLGDHEVVLTFDDGPWPATTPRVLAALASECVRATFFLIGKPAPEH